ncbi:class F sortase [Streptomyces sp. NBC_01275]|nr:class F sortase [Streptomyces sp. NBC_01275]
MPGERFGRPASGGRGVRSASGGPAVRWAPGGRAVRPAPGGRARRRWYRTRAFRLTRTLVLAATLAAVGVWSAQDEELPAAVSAAPGGSSGVVDREARPAGGADAWPTGATAGGGTGDAGPEGEAASGAGNAGASEAGADDARGPRREERGGASPGAHPRASGGASSPARSPGSRSPRPPDQALRPNPVPDHAQPPPSREPSRADPRRPGGAGRPGRSGAPHRASHPPLAPHRLPRSRATRLAIPYVDVDAPVMELRLDRQRRLTAPPVGDPNLVGWYADGPSPGEPGTAVAVGHLDTDTDRAVFWGLSELKPGRMVEVRRADGRVAVYTVDALRQYEKAHFPNKEVYGDRGRPELRLITCGGPFHRRTGYTGNLVVFAHLVTVQEPRAPAPGH